MFYVWFAKGYFNEELIAECRTEGAAMDRADEEFANGARDITVIDSTGAEVYFPVEEDDFLVDEY